ncbi:exo-alpha-sialidase [Psychromonas ossibalaenae]|uniref:exo-alpha-sialidase n=1 Tax=Psychromonas ossibalaenae TaxID=444922 RepID=UPI00036810C8|nr:exo-alpha-sialidase [Psychromonas ossibalaenae]
MKIVKYALALLLTLSSYCYAAGADNKNLQIGPQDYIEKWDLAEMGFPDQGYYDIADQPQYNPGLKSQTITFWFKIPQAGSVQQLVQKGNTSSGEAGWSLFTNNNSLYYRININGQKADLQADFADLNLEQWHHFTAVVDQQAGKLSAWINGQKLDQNSGEYASTFTPGEFSNEAPIRVHQKTSGYMVDDLRLYDRSLSEQEASSFIDNTNLPPQAVVDYKHLQDTQYLFSAQDSSDPEGDELQYMWDFGYGEIKFGKNLNHDFEWGGDYPVKLTVIDPWRNTDQQTVTISVSGEERPLREVVVYQPGTEGYACFRIPTIVKAGNGDLLAFAEGRVDNCGDHGNINVVLKRSSDDGITWGPLTVIAEFGQLAAQNMTAVYDEYYPHTQADGTPVVNSQGEAQFGRLMVMWNNADGGEADVSDDDHPAQRWVLYRTSLDHGVTWSEPTDITDQVRIPGQKMHIPPTGHAIQLNTQEAAEAGRFGRLFFSGQYNPVGATSATANENYAYWSDDHGETWEIGGLIAGESLNEVQAVELANGDIMFNSRNYRPTADKRRAVTLSHDGGSSFGETVDDDNLIEPTVASAVIRYTREDRDDKNRLLFSNPHSQSSRVNMTVQLSYDEGQSWPVKKTINPGTSAYSDLVIHDDMRIGLFYEATTGEIRYASFTLEYLTDGEDFIPE